MTVDPTIPTPEKDWRVRFLDALAETANVTASAAIAGIHRDTAYDHRNRDEEFRAAWESALDQAVDALEAEARRRALDGTRKPVFYRGKRAGFVREYSDTLMIFLLKAHRPNKFRERVSTEHSGEVKVVVEYADGDPPHAAEAAPGPD